MQSLKYQDSSALNLLAQMPAADIKVDDDRVATLLSMLSPEFRQLGEFLLGAPVALDKDLAVLAKSMKKFYVPGSPQTSRAASSSSVTVKERRPSRS